MTPKRKRLIVVSLLALLVACGLWLRFGLGHEKPPGSAPLEGDLAKIQGTWQFVSMEADGEVKPDEEIRKYTMVLTNDQWLVFDEGALKARTMIELDPTSDPKTIDLFTYDGRVLQGIYKLDGDQFTLCDRGVEKGDRPTEFGTKADSGLVLAVLKRVKQ